MTDAQTQLNRLAQRYAKALVDYHITKSGNDYTKSRNDYITLCDIQEMMDEVAQEVAAEAGY